MLDSSKVPPRVLVIAGSDSGGGAGIQADVKTVMALGGYAMTAITALTAQNTRGVFGVVPVAPEFIAQQIEVVLSDLGADAVKTGMLHSAPVIRAVARALQQNGRRLPLILDPVMLAKDGTPLLDPKALEALVECLVPHAAVLTPNAVEAEALAGVEVRRVEDMDRALDRLLGLGPQAVLLKGGHLSSDRVVDVLRTADGVEQRFESARIATRRTHGTGCTLASAIATGIAEGLTLSDSVSRAHRYVLGAIRMAFPMGSGHGPLNHAHLRGFQELAENARGPRILH